MLGPLPLLHQIVVGIAALVVGSALGLWLGWALPVEVDPSALGFVGSAVGTLVAYLLLHDSHQRPASRR